MRFIDFDQVRDYFRGKTVAIVGSGPSSLDNAPGFVDSHDVVVRVNNYKTGDAQGFRCDVHYSFFGGSIRKDRRDLENDGVKLCMCKLPNSQPIDSLWHRERGKMEGIDYRYIYEARKNWWFCDTYIPDDADFCAKFELLGNHQPTTGFAGILDLLECAPAKLYITGFDFFASGIHNVNEPWRAKNLDDPIRHRPDLELAWLRANWRKHLIELDLTLTRIIDERR